MASESVESSAGRESRWGTCYILTVLLCFVFPFAAPIVAVLLLCNTGMPESIAEAWAVKVLWGGVIGAVLFGLWTVSSLQ